MMNEAIGITLGMSIKGLGMLDSLKASLTSVAATAKTVSGTLKNVKRQKLNPAR